MLFRQTDGILKKLTLSCKRYSIRLLRLILMRFNIYYSAILYKQNIKVTQSSNRHQLQKTHLNKLNLTALNFIHHSKHKLMLTTKKLRNRQKYLGKTRKYKFNYYNKVRKFKLIFVAITKKPRQVSIQLKKKYRPQITS